MNIVPLKNTPLNGLYFKDIRKLIKLIGDGGIIEM